MRTFFVKLFQVLRDIISPEIHAYKRTSFLAIFGLLKKGIKFVFFEVRLKTNDSLCRMGKKSDIMKDVPESEQNRLGN